MSDIDNILDATLDDLEDLPESKPFPEGAHRALLTLTAKEVNSKPAIEAVFKAVETVELAAPTEDSPVKEGDEANVLYFMDNEFGQGKFKKIAKVLGEALNASSIREVVENTQSVEVLVITTKRANKKTGDVYMDVKELQVV